ncbi:PEP/pyruvate-binding domain-containing protein [Streptomyces sp. DSM 40750]|uniref:PEP/pyruvate-binding domain-containing protein n=1 Tax=Streptomyces sp. DSM 40750 TaxID=2801030 RepID=UPI00214ACC22|nr:PEP/pyruvate-binding domain-containing protein [Streptomyces sp. DSM 40750]UUU21233.1 PEP-utilizing enzyme [Streptomyces sp. DSM 40750]
MTTLDERHGEHREGAHDEVPSRGGGTLGSHIVLLSEPTASLPLLAGSKAAHLARAARAGLPVLPGFVIPHGPRDPHSEERAAETSALPRAWDELSQHGARPLVVRSSSPQEDTRESSLAGQFDSVLDVRGWEEFCAAVRTVLGSARRPDGGSAPMAVLVQPMLRARVGGVLFGADPVAGRTDRMLVSAVRGGPDTLVSGEQPGTSYWLSRWGRLLRTESTELSEPGKPGESGELKESAQPTEQAVSREPTQATEPAAPRRAADPRESAQTSESAAPRDTAGLNEWAGQTESTGARQTIGARQSTGTRQTIGARQSTASDHPLLVASDHPLLTASELRRLARLARRAARVFGGPQDIEFGFDEDGRLWLFQSRPITAMGARPPRGARLLGPGPVAETLPGQLEPLEEDLWVAPMARGLACALDIGGIAPRRHLRTAPVVTTVGGRAAADLRLLGAVPPRHPRLAWLNPAPGARRLGAAWRVGRLTAALPGLATDLVADVDRRLTETPQPGELPTAELISTLRWTRATLVSLHAQEALAGALLPEPHVTAAGMALATLAETRHRDLPDQQVVAAEPVVLALTAPSVWGVLRLHRPEATARNGSTVTTDAPTTPAAASVFATPTAVSTSAASSSPSVPHTITATLPASPHTASHRTAAAFATHHAASTSHRTASVSVSALPPREALRLRIRWVQELQVRMVREAVRRLLVRGVLGDARRAGLLRWKEFVTVLEAGGLPRDFEERLTRAASAPLPDMFRLAEDGVVVAERTARRSGDGGRGVSGGRAIGTAWDGDGTRPPDAVLVVRSLDPALAPLLPRLSGLVAQTGSPLSHLAVVAREFGVPAVVGVDDAVGRFPPGTRLTVDGISGDVREEGS